MEDEFQDELVGDLMRELQFAIVVATEFAFDMVAAFPAKSDDFFLRAHIPQAVQFHTFDAYNFMQPIDPILVQCEIQHNFCYLHLLQPLQELH